MQTVAGELVEMLGPEAIGSVQALVDRKTSLGERMTRLVRETREAETEAGAGDMPVYGRVVTVTSEASARVASRSSRGRSARAICSAVRLCLSAGRQLPCPVDAAKVPD